MNVRLQGNALETSLKLPVEAAMKRYEDNMETVCGEYLRYVYPKDISDKHLVSYKKAADEFNNHQKLSSDPKLSWSNFEEVIIMLPILLTRSTHSVFMDYLILTL